MRKLLFFFTFSLITINCFSQIKSVTPDKKIALVIGVANYKFYPLTNPINDASDMEIALQSLGFEVTHSFDENFKAMSSTIERWATKINNADVCLVFYSGHGAELNGENYIFPKDANPHDPTDLRYDTYPIGKILGKMDNAKIKTSILILDACRSNPFTKNWSKGIDPYEGLANINAPSGMFIGFAASPGKVANGCGSRNSFYTAAILRYINDPNVNIDQLFNKVNKEVRKKTGDQVPFKSSSLDDDFYFNQSNHYQKKETPNSVYNPNTVKTDNVKSPAITKPMRAPIYKPNIKRRSRDDDE